MEILNPEVQEHVLNYRRLIEDLKKDHPDLTDNKLAEIFKDKDILDTRKIAIDTLLWPFRVDSNIFVPTVKFGFPFATKWKRETIFKICKVIGFLVNWFWMYGIVDFIITFLVLSQLSWLSLFLPVIASMLYYINARYFNMVYIITEVELHYYEQQEKTGT